MAMSRPRSTRRSGTRICSVSVRDSQGGCARGRWPGWGWQGHDFTIDWDQQRATCPEGRTSLSWSPAVDRGHNDVIKIKFSAKDCGACHARARCTEAKRRSITVRPRDQYEALHAARSREASAEYRSDYKRRAGIEGTISQGVRTCGLR